ncbi:Chitinase 2 [Basidiobolus ranarum]|uniref:chitinase n=1 Tax=Basidiobolus ranarum TaxID=34480 RepID=A0ABR2WPN0_9FUNG
MATSITQHPETTKTTQPNHPTGTSTPSGAFDATCNDNLVVYWGQNSFGGSGGGPSGWQMNLADYCRDDTIDVIPVAFLNTFFGKGGLPQLNLANTCNPSNSAMFPNSELLHCPSVGDDIKFCQSRGKSIILSLGGAGGSYGFQDDNQARDFADQIWNLFLGGESNTRPFDNAVLDGVDLDIEGGGPTGYIAFIDQLRSHYKEDASKKYLITGAPQCVYPDAQLGSALNNAWFDLVFVQFYNNPCGLQYYDNYRAWNFGIWDYWATHISHNPDVKVFIGAPAAPKAAGSGYVSIEELKTISQETRDKYTSFGGVMFWDASQAWANHVPGGNYAEATKQFLTNGGGCNVKPNLPSCGSASEWNPSHSYSGGSLVSHSGYIWKALWWTQGHAPGVTAGYWNPVSGCSGDSHSTYVPSQPKPAHTSGSSCTGESAWKSNVAYTGGERVSYNGHIWQAKWWTKQDTPGSNEQNVWTDMGSCTSIRRRSLDVVTNPPATQPSDFLVHKNLGNFFVTFSNLKLESNQFQMGIKITSQKPGYAISDEWRLSFPFNSTITHVDGASSEQTRGNLVLSATSPKEEFKATQFMSIFVAISGEVDMKYLERFPFPDITKAEFSA